MTESRKFSMKNEIIDDIIARRETGVSPLLEKKLIAIKFNTLRNISDIMYFSAVPFLFFCWTKRNTGRAIYLINPLIFGVSYFALSKLISFQYEKTKTAFNATDEDFEKRVKFFASVVKDKFDPYEKLPQN